ncbi:MAG: glycosyltransferase family 2 protein [Pirellulaceae bacterium]
MKAQRDSPLSPTPLSQTHGVQPVAEDIQAPEFSIVIPCFNEERCIVETIEGIRRDLVAVGPYELIVVNDGSTDDSPKLLESLSQSDPELRVLHHSHNQGYGASLKTGLRHATAPCIVITDADGTYPNDRIPDLLARVKDVDMVIGSRQGPNVHYPFIRRIPKVFLRRFACWITRTHIPDLNSGLRVFRRDVAKRLLFMVSDGFSFTTTITLSMLTNGYNVCYVPISYAPRVGKSKIKPIRDTLSFIYLIMRVGIYFAPARILYPLSVLSFLLFLSTMSYDMFGLHNLTDKTVLLFMFTVGIALVTLLADVMSMIIKKIAVHDDSAFDHGRRAPGLNGESGASTLAERSDSRYQRAA